MEVGIQAKGFYGSTLRENTYKNAKLPRFVRRLEDIEVILFLSRFLLKAKNENFKTTDIISVRVYGKS